MEKNIYRKENSSNYCVGFFRNHPGTMGDQENAEASAEATVNKAMANVSISESNVSSAIITNQNDNQIITNQEDTEQNIESEQNNSLVKIYVGSMPPEIDEDGLKSLLSENSLPQPETVLVKRGYAFLEFTDQIKADETISVVDGKKKPTLYLADRI